MIHLLSIKYIYTFSDLAAVSKCFKGCKSYELVIFNLVCNLNSVI